MRCKLADHDHLVYTLQLQTRALSALSPHGHWEDDSGLFPEDFDWGSREELAASSCGAQTAPLGGFDITQELRERCSDDMGLILGAEAMSMT